MDTASRPSESILWQQVWGLAILQAAVAFSWQIYSAAQPTILNKYGLTAALGVLSLVPGFLSLLLDPLMGRFTDAIHQRLGSRLPAINLGVILTSLIFLTVALSLQSSWLESVKWVIPGLMVAWVATMKIFQNPSIALVKRYAPPKDLPQAAAILTVVGGVIGAIRPFASAAVRQFGPSLTFLAGGAVLLTALAFLQKLTPKTPSGLRPDEATLTGAQLAMMFIAGAGVQLASGLLFFVAPSQLQAGLPQVGSEFIVSGLLLVSGVSAFPLGKWIKRVGVERALLVALGGTLAVLTLLWPGVSMFSALGVGAACGVVIGLLFNLGVPFALARVPASQASFAIGLFFGGGGMVAASLALFRLQYGKMPLPLALGLNLLALGLGCAALALNKLPTAQRPQEHEPLPAEPTKLSDQPAP